MQLISICLQRCRSVLKPLFSSISAKWQLERFALGRFQGRLRGRRLILALALMVGLVLPQALQMGRANAIDPSLDDSAEITHLREFRGVWAASVVNIDWPSASNLSVERQQADLIAILDRMQSLNLNALVLQIRPAGDAFYASDLEPWSFWLTGEQGRAPSPYYDPLEFAIEEAHARGIELHAWFNPYRAKLGSSYRLSPNHMANRFPQYAYQYGDLIWMDPGAAVVQQQTYDVILDVTRRYDVDGIHLDDYFYPYPKDGMAFPDSATYNAYRQSGGTLGLDDWRRQNVNTLVERLYTGIKAEKPNVKFGISPFGIYRPGQPAGIVGMDQYREIYADPKLWLQKGWLDYLAPQLYWRIDPAEQSYPRLLEWWTQQNTLDRHIYAGNYLSKLDNQTWDLEEYRRQVEISRGSNVVNNGSVGNIFYSLKVFMQDWYGVNAFFRRNIYPTPALTPAMPWLDAIAPEPVQASNTEAGQIAWEPTYSEALKGLTLYKQSGDRWVLQRILSPTVTRATVPPGVYAIRPVDRAANEGEPSIVTVRGFSRAGA
jgi:uncharacterized lipoprotein YddW (UPF0748 family)